MLRASMRAKLLSGAAASTYTLTTADGGHVVRSTVRATNVDGASQPTASSSTSAAIDVPAVTTAPHISGHARVGKKLSGSHGLWTHSLTYRYQWLRCNAHGGSCSSIHRATHSTYKLTHHDAAHRLRVRITATDAAGSKTSTSATSARPLTAERPLHQEHPPCNNARAVSGSRWRRSKPRGLVAERTALYTVEGAGFAMEGQWSVSGTRMRPTVAKFRCGAGARCGSFAAVSRKRTARTSMWR